MYASQLESTSLSQWPSSLSFGSVAAVLLGLRDQIPPGAWMFFSYICCVLLVRGPCEELITRPEASYRLWCVVLSDLETWRMLNPWPALGPQRHRKTKIESRERYPLCRDFRNDHITYNHYSKFRPTRMGYLRKIWEIYLWVNIFCSEIKILREQIESRFSCSND